MKSFNTSICIQLAVSSLGGQAYLLGLLANDILFDIMASSENSRTYYCQLVHSFQYSLGVVRILAPIAVVGLSQVALSYLLENGSARKLQQVTAGSLAFISTPLLGLSLQTCIDACSKGFLDTWTHGEILLVAHLLMLVILVSAICIQTRILLIWRMWESSHPVLKPIMIISGLCYLIAVVVGNMLFDLLGNTEATRTYYCSLQGAMYANPFRCAPLLGAVAVTAIGLGLKAKESFANKMSSDLFIFELSLLCAMWFVGLPLLAKCIQLQTNACAETSTGQSGPWPVHKNLLMSHMCVFLILMGGLFAQAVILLKETEPARRRESRKSMTPPPRVFVRNR